MMQDYKKKKQNKPKPKSIFKTLFFRNAAQYTVVVHICLKHENYLTYSTEAQQRSKLYIISQTKKHFNTCILHEEYLLTIF